MNEQEALKTLAGWLNVPEADIAIEGDELVQYVEFGLQHGLKYNTKMDPISPDFDIRSWE